MAHSMANVGQKLGLPAVHLTLGLAFRAAGRHKFLRSPKMERVCIVSHNGSPCLAFYGRDSFRPFCRKTGLRASCGEPQIGLQRFANHDPDAPLSD